MTALQAEYGDDLVVMGTDGGAFPDGSAAGKYNKYITASQMAGQMLQTVSSRPDELFQISGLNYLYQVSHTSSVVGLIQQFPMFCPLSACMAGSLKRLQPQFGANGDAWP